MEVEIEVREGWWAAALPALVLALLGLALLGRAVTPEGGGLLTPSDWRLRAAERAYREERAALREEAEALAALLDRAPDPVRAGLAADRIAQRALDGAPALALQREALAGAAEGVRLWAMGGGSREAAVEALERAVSLLGGRSEP